MTLRFVAATALALVTSGTMLAQQHTTLPSRLSDREFWRLSQEMSEPDGSFQSDNLVSNETGFQKVLPELTDRHAPGGVYLGVGPEQNFTYIAALRPSVAFIVDVRRENRDLHLMYKALFELAANRLEFVSMLFSRPIPDGLTSTATAVEIFAAIDKVPRSASLEGETAARIESHLTRYHRLTLSQAEVDTIKAIHATFAGYGLNMSYSARRMVAPRTTLAAARVNYATLMQATDAHDLPSSYLSSEARFAVVKDLHIRNLIIPVVGNFAGPKALRAVGDWLRARQLVVSAFYLSNVEDYLRPPPVMSAFCQNAASLPLDDKSTFIRSGARAALTPAPGSSPLPVGVIRLSGAYSPGAGVQTNRAVVTFSDGTTRELSTDELAKLPVFTGGGMSMNRLGFIRADTTACGAAR